MSTTPVPMRPVAHPVDVEGLRDRVHTVLDRFLTRKTAELSDIRPECVPLVTAISDLLGNGKRLRPAFCYWGWRAAGGEEHGDVVTAASSLELFQAAALVHDDVMDGSDTRRGMPAVHRRFAGAHEDAGWRGSSERFGLAGAVLAGDLCLVWSDELFSATRLPPESLARARPVFDRMRTELMGGQYLDVLEQALAGAGAGDAVQRARTVITYKSAKYSVEQPLLLGGLLAGAPAHLLAAYSDYGLHLGEAFQLRDDVLGVFGDPVDTGKPAGDDLREGKRTVLVATALRSASRAQADTLRCLLGDPLLDDAQVDTLREIIVTTRALATVEQMIEDLVARAHAALAHAALPTPAASVLADLITAATTRVA